MTEEREARYEAATTWALDLEAARRRQLAQARGFALAMAAIAVLEALALLLLTPLKTVAPIPVLVDRETGYVQVLRGGGTEQARGDLALTRSLLAQYVAAREGFDITTLGAEYRKVALWSAGPARSDYLASLPASNPASPLRLYPRAAIVDVTVKSVSPIGPRAAMVRFDLHRRDPDAAAAAPQPWVAFVAFRFTDAAMPVADRLINPLGFQVTRYRKDAEVPTADLPQPPPAAAPAPPPATAPLAAAPKP